MTRIAYDVVQEDRADLEGKIVDYVFTNGDVHKALVVGCNRSVGVTLVNSSNKKSYHLCLRGPVTSDPSDFTDSSCTWDEMYDTVVDSIENGVVYAGELLILKYGDVVSSTCQGNCAYSQ